MPSLKPHPLWQASLAATTLVCLLMVAGCTTTSKETVTSATNLTTTTLSLALCPPAGEPEITIDPISNHSLGDTITFAGTTNLKPGEVLDFKIPFGFPTSLGGPQPCGKCQEIVNDSVTMCCGTGIDRQVTIMPGMCGINTWSLDVDTSQHDFAAGMTYVVDVYGRNWSVWNTSSFSIVE